MEVATLIEFLRDLAPQLALPEGVNPAFSRGWAAVKHLGVCIDPTAGVIRNALNRGINILVTYHPWHGEAGQLLSEKDLVIIPLHTAWDNVPEGVNLTFAKELGLADIQFHRDLVSGIANLPLRVILERCRRIVGQNIIPAPVFYRFKNGFGRNLWPKAATPLFPGKSVCCPCGLLLLIGCN
jgi:putative NIF3 family GTP cyclohydrolase 1 type 2